MMTRPSASFKAVSKLVYRADKFIYVTDRMADKERDGQIARVWTPAEPPERPAGDTQVLNQLIGVDENG